MSNIEEARRKAIADEEERPGYKVDAKRYWYEKNGELIIALEISRASYVERE